MKNSNEVVVEDLKYICDSLTDEFSKLSGKTLLIVGGGGFLGYYLVKSVLYWNHLNPHKTISLTVLDSFIRGRPKWLTDLTGTPELAVQQHDITQLLPSGMPNFSYIIHAASIASPNFYRKYPIETMDANVNGLRVLLEHSRLQQATDGEVEGFLFFSTSEIYGDPTPNEIPTSEDYKGNVSCTGPRACYDESKRFGETLCVNFAQQFNLPVKIARPFNNYGPGLKISDRRVIPDLARDIFAGNDIVLLSDGTPTRTFCYVADAVIGYIKILVKGRPAKPYNIGTDSPEVSIRQLADMVVTLSARTFGYRGRIVHKVSEDKNYLTDNPTRRCPSIARAKLELGYAPQVALEDGLMRTFIWYSANLEASDA